MPDGSDGPIGGVARAHIGVAGALAIYLSHRGAVAAEFGRCVSRRSGGCGARDEVAGARRITRHTLGIEWAGDFAVVGLGSAKLACDGLYISAAPQLVAETGCGWNRGRIESQT